jgi:recombination protein RecA
MVFEPDHFEHGWSIMKDSLLMEPILIICDSVTAMIPQKYLEGSVDESGRIGEHAALMSRMLNEMTKRIKETKTNLLMLNQIRAVINTGPMANKGPKEDSTGGNALKFYASVRIKLKKGQKMEITGQSIITGKSEKKAINQIVYATAIKNRIDAPYKTGPLYIRFGKGFDNILSMIELAANTKVINQKGAYFSFKSGGKQIFNVQGKEKLRELLLNDNKTYSLLRDSLVVKEDSEAEALYGEEQDEAMLENVGEE